MASKIHWITILIVMLPACHEDSVNSKKQGSVANPSPASSQKENRIMKQNTSNPPERIVKSDEEWRKILTPDQYRVMREKGTEPAFTGAYWATKTPGIYLCAACGLDVFDSKSKFDSGTGWPSFWQPVTSDNVSTKSDESLGMVRIEVLCSRCDGHLGHVFYDGPQPTGLRYCINSTSLKLLEQ